MFKIDLHTHSIGSPDGGIAPWQYRKVLEGGILDYIAVTDHDTIDVAVAIRKELGDRIIVGEEIMTSEGEIIGLFLESAIPPRLTAAETVRRIKDQGGIVCVPHPFETIRHGLHPATLEAIETSVDIIEVYNGRAFLQNKNEQVAVWAKLNKVIGVANSDAHGIKGLGTTYTQVTEPISRENLLTALSSGTPLARRPSFQSLLYPQYHRMRKRLQK